MTDQELLLEQAQMIKAANPLSHVFTYANLVKALPWMTEVREKLDDPAYSGFFLKFKAGGAFPNGSYHVPACTGSKCSVFYHDQEQTPEHPSGDGSCTEQCDCGTQPCGEYLWDHRNGTMLRDFLVNEYILGPHSAGNEAIDGLFIDDFWCSNAINGSCGDPVQGPSEIDRNSQVDMGLSDDDVSAITRGWLQTQTAVQSALLAAGKYTWSLLPGQNNANASPKMLDSSNCAAMLEPACSSEASPYASAPLLFGLTTSQNKSDPLPQLNTDIAAFLAMRGPYAYAGWGQWGLSWPAGQTWQKQGGHVVDRPQELSYDYGTPTSACKQTAAGVFERHYSKSAVTVDCNTFSANITRL
jgi:hypothetical protein